MFPRNSDVTVLNVRVKLCEGPLLSFAVSLFGDGVSLRISDSPPDWAPSASASYVLALQASVCMSSEATGFH